MTGAARLSSADKKLVTDYIVLSLMNPPEAAKLKITPEARAFISFLDQNPVTSIDDKFMENLTEFVKRMSANDFLLRSLLNDPDKIKKGVRTVAQVITAQIIWVYADAYEKLKEAPTQSEFREQITTIMLADPQFQPFISALKTNAMSEESLKREMSMLQNRLSQANTDTKRAQVNKEIDSVKARMDAVSLQTTTLGKDTYPLGSSTSPMVNQIFDIVYKYYFGETVSASSIVSGAWKAIVGVFGSLGAMAFVAAIVYFVFLR